MLRFLSQSIPSALSYPRIARHSNGTLEVRTKKELGGGGVALGLVWFAVTNSILFVFLITANIFRCCECYASERNRMTRCGECDACRAQDCGTCKFCLDRPKFGGFNKLKKPCVHRECKYQSFAETYVEGKMPGQITSSSSSAAAAASTKKKRPRDSSNSAQQPPQQPKLKKAKME